MTRWPLWLVPALVLGCYDHTSDGGGDTGAATVTGQIALAALDQQLVEANCAYLVHCGFYADLAVCESAITFNLAVALDARVKSGKIRYDAAAAFACVQGIRAGGCYFYDPAPPSPASCQKIFGGTVDDEGPCTTDTECRSGVCDPPYGCDPGQCCTGKCLTFPTPTVVPEGAACTSDSEQLTCAGDLVCKLTPDAPNRFTCVPRVGVGENCDEAPCQRLLFCLPSATGPAVCVKYPAEGEPCSDAMALCASRTNYCDKTTFKCVPLDGVGASCESDITCARTAFCDSGTCQPRHGPGGACRAPHECFAYLDCIADVCTQLEPDPICP